MAILTPQDFTVYVGFTKTWLLRATNPDTGAATPIVDLRLIFIASPPYPTLAPPIVKDSALSPDLYITDGPNGLAQCTLQPADTRGLPTSDWSWSLAEFGTAGAKDPLARGTLHLVVLTTSQST